jgi:hypothetical protein
MATICLVHERLVLDEATGHVAVGLGAKSRKIWVDCVSGTRAEGLSNLGGLRPGSTSTFDCFKVSKVSTVIHTVLQSLVLRA